MTALQGLRVVDATDDSGRFGTKLLTEFGADVVRVTTGSPGKPMKSRIDSERGGVLDWWYDGGKERHLIDFATTNGVNTYKTLTAEADLVIETFPPGFLESLSIDHANIVKSNPKLVQVSLTPFGRTGPRSHWVSSDLTSAALGGFMSVTGLPDRPLNLWGRQAYNYSGFMAALCGITGVLAARRDGLGQLVDVSAHETISGSIENIMMQWLFDDVLPLPKLAERQGALHWLRLYDLAPCSSGHVMITPTPVPENVFQMMVDDGFAAGNQWLGKDVEQILIHVDDAMDTIRDWVKTREAKELWEDAQNNHVAFGGVLNIADACESPQFAHRNFFKSVIGSTVKQPSRLVRFSDNPVNDPLPPASIDTPIEEIVARWSQTVSKVEKPEKGKPLQGIRVLDLTWVLAGPFATRMLAELGADVVRLQNEGSSTVVNSPDHPFYFVWGRGKRSITLNMKHELALKVLKPLIEKSDVLIENYSAGVLDRWGLDWETLHQWNPKLVYVTMSGCGQDGPWQHVISYAPTIHAISGITHLTNFPDEGAIGSGFSLNDHLAGFSAALSTVAALHARGETGKGQRIDMSQHEIGTYSIGPAALDYFSNNFVTQPNGNQDGLQDHVPNNVFATTDGHLAITATNDSQWVTLQRIINDPDLKTLLLATEDDRRLNRTQVESSLATWASQQTSEGGMSLLQEAGVPAGKVQNASELIEQDPQHKARQFWQPVIHDNFGQRIVDTFPALWNGKRLTTDLLSPAYLGEHNFDIWTELGGLSFDEVAEGIGNDLFS